MTLKDAIQYEVAGSWWAGECSWRWLQSFAAWHYGRKAARKYRRYARYVEWLAKNGKST